MASQSSLQSDFLRDHASFTADDIASALVNDTVEVTVFLQKDAEGGVTTVRYVLPDGHGQTEITNIKLRRADGTVLSSSPVYIPVTDLVTLQHTITHREVSENGNTISAAGRFAG